MRRTREGSGFTWKSVGLGLAITGLVGGIGYRLLYPQNPSSMLPKQPTLGDALEKQKEKTREADAESFKTADSGFETDVSPMVTLPVQKRSKLKRIENENPEVAEASDGSGELAEATREPARVPENQGLSSEAVGENCGAVEFLGSGPSDTQVSTSDWNQVMSLYHAGKKDLVTWLETQTESLPPLKRVQLTRVIEDVRIQRPPVKGEPDLSWRGIGVITKDLHGETILRVGAGFIKLAKERPKVARFELTRLLAQTLAPCEVNRLVGWSAWDETLSCLGYSPVGTAAQGCGEGSYSEAGWAVSTLLAYQLAPRACLVPAINEPQVAGCFSKLRMNPEPKKTARLTSEPSSKNGRTL